MSLSKQMIIFVTSILLVVLLGTFVLNFNNTKSFLINQLESHAQDTATSLGLSLSSVADPEEPSSMETMINAVFDRGYYSHITLYDVDDNVLYQRKNPNKIEGIPSWFIDLIPIQAPSADSLIQSGWIPVGKMVVQSHPGYAYIELWKTTVSLLIWFFSAALFAIIIAVYALRIMLKPLKKMENQAEAIVRKEYLLQEEMPNTTEFKQVVSAMNTMVHKMKHVFDRDAKMAEKLQKIAYQDSVTGLSNRLHFDMNIQSLLDPTESSAGMMLLVRVLHLKELNEQFGYLIGDKFIKSISESMAQNLRFSNAFSARLNGSELICVIPSSPVIQVQEAADKIAEQMKAVDEELNIDQDLAAINIGIIHYQPGQKRGELLSQLDFAIKEAEKKGINAHYYQAETETEDSNDVWNQMLQSAIEENRFVLFQQSAYTQQRGIFAKELLLRLKDVDGNIHSAGYFMPAVKRLNRVTDIDQLVIKLALKYLTGLNTSSQERIAINLTHSVLQSEELKRWLLSSLKQINTKQLVFEAPEQMINEHKAQSWPLIQEFKRMGIQFGIDNFGSQFANMSYLQELRPDFIKLDMGFSQAIEKDEQTGSYISSLVEMCDSLDIQLIAMAVEDDSQKSAFEALGVKIFQGYLYGAPKPLSNKT